MSGTQQKQEPKYRSDDPSPGPSDYNPHASSSSAYKFSFKFRSKPVQMQHNTPAANAYNIQLQRKDQPGTFTASFYAPTQVSKKKGDTTPGPAEYHVNESFAHTVSQAGRSISFGHRLQPIDSSAVCVSPQRYYPNFSKPGAARSFSFGSRCKIPTGGNTSPGPFSNVPNFNAIAKKTTADIQIKPITHKLSQIKATGPGPADYQKAPNANTDERSGAGHMGRRYRRTVHTF